MTLITVEQFRDYVASLSDRTLQTIGGKSEFAITRSNSSFAITLPNGRTRNVSGSNVQRVLNIFNRTGSLTTTDYQQVTTNSSYLLAILQIMAETNDARPTIVGIGEVGANGFIVEEGHRVPVYHLRLERDPRIVRRKKREVMEATGRLACECCGFNFVAFYGELGRGYAECHHRVWLSKTPPGDYRLTETSDLAIVCANCHRMLHRDPDLDVESLRRLISERQKTSRNRNG